MRGVIVKNITVQKLLFSSMSFMFLLCCLRPAFAQTSNATQSSKPPASGLMGATAAQAKEAKSGAQYYGGTLDKRSKVKIPGMHTSLTIPSNFPVNTYPNNIISTSFANSTRGPAVATASIISSDAPKMIYDWYYAQCSKANWSIKTPGEQDKVKNEKSGLMYRMNATKDGQQLICAFIRKPKHSITIININWILKQKV